MPGILSKGPKDRRRGFVGCTSLVPEPSRRPLRFENHNWVIDLLFTKMCIRGERGNPGGWDTFRISHTIGKCYPRFWQFYNLLTDAGERRMFRDLHRLCEMSATVAQHSRTRYFSINMRGLQALGHSLHFTTKTYDNLRKDFPSLYHRSYATFGLKVFHRMCDFKIVFVNV